MDIWGKNIPRRGHSQCRCPEAGRTKWVWGTLKGRKTPDAGRDGGQEETGTPEDEMAGWHHRLDGCGFGWTPGVGDGQGGLACCSSRGLKESDTPERLN